MKRVLLLLLSVAALCACDEDKKKADLLEKAGVEAGVPSTPTGVNVIPPATGTASTVTATAKPPKDCGTGDPVIDDPDLDAELRLKLKKPKDKNPDPLTSKDLAAVTSVSLMKKASLDSLDPCVFPKLTGLRFLYLPKGDYSDLGPIANLVKLEALSISNSAVSDLSQLAKLTLLDQLFLVRTPVRDISALANNVNLTELTLDDVQVSDISVLAKLTKLQKLSLKNTLVTDVSPLAKLTSLKSLNVAGTALTNLDTLAPLRAKGLKIITS